jgi:hypothetical protein
MGRKHFCKICSDPVAAERIKSAIEVGCKQKAIAADNPGFSVSQISRHRNRCLAPASVELTTETRSAQIERWLARADASYAVAASQGDAKAQIAAISAATRALGQLEKQVKAETEAEKADADDRHSISSIDKTLHDFMQERDAARGGISTKAQCLCQEESDFGQLILKIWADRAILPMLLTTCANYIPERVTENVNANAND